MPFFFLVRFRNEVTTEGAVRFLRERQPDHFVVARGGKALFTGREFLEEHCDDSEGDVEGEVFSKGA